MPGSILDLDQFRYPSEPDLAALAPVRRRDQIPGGRFLKGPVPLVWLQVAAKQPGRALHVGIVLWFLVGLTRSAQVTLKSSELRGFGLDRFAARRGLKALEKANLVTVTRHPGRAAVVTVVGQNAR
jgi:hypothetical protein